MGAIPFKYLTGMSGHKQNLEYVRGYPVESIWYPGIPVIGTFHPSYIRRGASEMFPVLVHDLHKALQIAKGKLPWATAPEQVTYQLGGVAELKQMLDILRSQPDRLLAYDIETRESAKTNEDEYDSLSPNAEIFELVQLSIAPTTGLAVYWNDETIPLLKEIFATINPKSAFNGWLFDNRVLEAKRLILNGELRDAMAAWHHLQPDLPANLQFVSSFYGMPRPWKHEMGADLVTYGIRDVDAVQRIESKINSDLAQMKIPMPSFPRPGVSRPGLKPLPPARPPAVPPPRSGVPPPCCTGGHGPVPGESREKYIIVSDKPNGIEPGFLCFINNETFQTAVREIIGDILKNPLHEQHDFFKSHKTNPDLRTSPDDVTHFLQNDTCRKVIFELVVEKVPLWLVKQDYQDPKPGEDTVTVDAPGIAGTNKMQEAIKNFKGSIFENPAKRLVTSIYQIARANTPIEENGNAILECLSPNVATLCMPTQKQNLLKGVYGTGKLKFMTCSEWKKGFHDFSNQLVTDGSVGFLVKKETNRSDDSINNLGRHLTFALLCSDYDFMGSRGGNKGRVGNDFFGIDFGHAFRDPNEIISHVQDDFSLDWKNSTVKKFKNLSVFNDTLLSEKIQGLLLLYKLRNPQAATIPEHIREIVNSQDKKFAAQLSEIHSRTNEQMFDAYIDYFTKKPKAIVQTTKEAIDQTIEYEG